MLKPKLNPNGYGNVCQSYYVPVNKEKYKGSMPIICRSSWERRFCEYCDLNSSITYWSSEGFTIPYISPIDKKYHNYFIDFVILVKRKTNDKVKQHVILIEIKPKNQTKPPIPTPKNRMTIKYKKQVETYLINQSKWKATKEFCKKKGFEFLILTEDTFNSFH